MLICGWEKFSMVDYPKKIACTLFTHGCNFRCPFCHNAALVTDAVGETVSEEEILKYLAARQGLVDAVVISGGEPTLQPGLMSMVRDFKALGYLVKLDTNGTNPLILKSLIEQSLIDYVAMDVKSGQSGYARAAGVDRGLNGVRTSIELLKKGDVDYEFRTTIVDELHTDNDIRELGELIAGAKRCYLQKFADTGTCIQSNLHHVPKERAEHFLSILRQYVDAPELRNY